MWPFQHCFFLSRATGESMGTWATGECPIPTVPQALVYRRITEPPLLITEATARRDAASRAVRWMNEEWWEG